MPSVTSAPRRTLPRSGRLPKRRYLLPNASHDQQPRLIPRQKQEFAGRSARFPATSWHRPFPCRAGGHACAARRRPTTRGHSSCICRSGDGARTDVPSPRTVSATGRCPRRRRARPWRSVRLLRTVDADRATGIARAPPDASAASYALRRRWLASSTTRLATIWLASTSAAALSVGGAKVQRKITAA